MKRIRAAILLLVACTPPGEGSATVDSAASGPSDTAAPGRASATSMVDSANLSRSPRPRVSGDSMLRDSAFEPTLEIDEKSGAVKPVRRPR